MQFSRSITPDLTILILRRLSGQIYPRKLKILEVWGRPHAEREEERVDLKRDFQRGRHALTDAKKKTEETRAKLEKDITNSRSEPAVYMYVPHVPAIVVAC